MNAISSPVPGADDHLVILRCPNCQSSEPIKAAAISEGVQVVICRQCGEGWAAKPAMESVPKSDCLDASGRSLIWADAHTIDAVRRPLVAYSDDHPDPWARRLESDYDMPEKRTSPVFGWLVVLLSGLFLAGFFGARQQVVAAVPDLAGLYAMIGLPAHGSPLDIVDVKAAVESTGFETTFNIALSVRNRAEREMTVPDLRIEFLDRYSRLVRAVPMTAAADRLAAGKRMDFRQSIKDFPRESVSVRVTFQNKTGQRQAMIAARSGG